MAHFASKSASKLNEPLFFLGQNSRGEWVIRELHGRMEGVFTARKEAIRFALYESGSRNPSVIAMNGPLEMEALR
ncbi:MAG: hypothetical protein H7Y62_01790 [Hyphomicrobium sp.]|nr:hypothetical protein [Hyphomicrobium sp.]